MHERPALHLNLSTKRSDADTMKNEDMPDTITTPDCQTFWKTGLIGRALPPAATHGIVPGERTHEYWIHPWDDSLRLYAADPMRWFLD